MLRFLTFLVICIAAVQASSDAANITNEIMKPAMIWGWDERIVGGDPAKPNSIPHMILILAKLQDATGLCGGVILDRRNVITAAHCILPDAEEYIIAAGAHRIKDALKPNSKTQVTEPRKIIVHPDFNKNTLDNDVAIIHLKKPLRFNKYVKAIELADQNQVFPVGSEATISGWGKLSLDDDQVDENQVLYVNTIDIMDIKKCREMVEEGTGGTIPINGRLCGGPPGDGVCQGDSGGPMTVDGKLAGITSFVIRGDCSEKYPSFYVQASLYTDWFNENKSFGNRLIPSWPFFMLQQVLVLALFKLISASAK